MYIQFANRTAIQLQVAFYNLRERYCCRIEIVKKLCHGLYSGYIAINKEITAGTTAIAKKLQNIEVMRARTIRNCARPDITGTMAMMRGQARKLSGLPNHAITTSLLDIYYTRHTLTKHLKHG